VIVLGNIGACLTTRALGKQVRELIEEELGSSSRVLLDFAGVEMASHSFCDEAFGKLLLKMGFKEFKRRIRFSCCAPEVESVIKFALKTRLEEEKMCVIC